jgi:hypothetical protein
VRKSGPAQRKLGTLQKGDRIADKYHKTDIDRLALDIAMGVPLAIAAASVGITARTVELWLDSHPEFAEKLAVEKRRVILEALDGIRSCTSKEREFRHLSWFLETVYRNYFAPPDKGFHLTQNNLVIGELDEARRILDAAKALPYRSGDQLENSKSDGRS